MTTSCPYKMMLMLMSKVDLKTSMSLIIVIYCIKVK